MTQYIWNSRTGQTMIYSPLILPQKALLHSGLGWHGPYESREALDKYYNDNKAKNPGWKAPSGNPVTSFNNADDALKDQGNAAVEGAKSAVGLSDEDIRSWFIRIGEVLLGLILIGVGVAKLTGVSNIASKAVKAAI